MMLWRGLSSPILESWWVQVGLVLPSKQTLACSVWLPVFRQLDSDWQLRKMQEQPVLSEILPLCFFTV